MWTMAKKLFCHRKIRTQSEGVREQITSYEEFRGGHMEHGRAEKCIKHFKKRPQGNVKTVWVYICI